jgi:hypothetical protein
MHLETALWAEHSRAQTNLIADAVGNDPAQLAELVALMLGDEPTLSQRAAWPVGVVLERHPALIEPHLAALLARLQADEPPHPAVARQVMRSLVGVPLPEAQQGAWLDLCFTWLQDPNCPVAIRVHAMQVAFDLAKPYPELQQELRLVLTAHLPDSRAGFRSRAKKLLAQLA